LIPYKLYLDLSGGKNPDGYFEVSAVSVAPFTEQSIDNMVTTRKQWGEVQIKNKPFDGVMLYNQITALKPTQEIHLKFVSAYETIYGYFGIVDCKLNDDQKVLTINVTTLDQYTEFLENRDEEVKLFDEVNQIVNGDFSSWFEGVPVGWNVNTETVVEQAYFLSSSAIKIKRYFDLLNVGDGGINRTILSVLKGKQVQFSFLWALVGDTSDKEDLEFEIALYGTSNTYYLDSNNNWSLTQQRVKYTKSPTLPIPYASVQNYISVSKTTNYTPEHGSIVLNIYHSSDAVFTDDTYLYVTDVVLSVSAIALNTIKLEFDTENLINKQQQDIYWKDKKGEEKYFYKWNKDASLNIEDMFDSNGVPMLGAMPMSSNSGMTYSDLVSIFENDSTHLSYKFELSKITVFKGSLTKNLLSQNRYYYGVAEFSREEIYIEDHEYTADDLANGLCSESEVGHYAEPERSVGWSRIGTPQIANSNMVLWVRFPFNKATDTWVLGDVSHSTGTLRSYQGLFDYHDSLTSIKQYPVQSSNTLEINNAIDFRELITQVYQQTHISLRGKKVYSNFLWNDALSVDETKAVYGGNDSECNYVTMTDTTDDTEPKNILNKIFAVHTYEFVPLTSRTPSDEDKSILKTSAKKLMDDLFDVYLPKCFWFIDVNGDLHIEHLKYFDRINTAKDITTPAYKYLGNYSEWEYIKDKLYSKEEYTTPNSGYLDFNKSIVTFDKITSNKRGEDIKGSYAASIITTDVQYCAENPNNIQNGIVLVTYETKDGTNKAKYGRGQYSGKSVINGDLSISSLLEDYATYEGTWNAGSINGKSQVFNFLKRSRQGIEISIKGIFLDKVILSKLGIGVIKPRTIDYQNENTKLTAVYRYSDDYLVLAPNVLMGFGEPLPSTNEVATITTDSTVTDITETSAMCTGIISADGGSQVTERGICYGITYGLVDINGTKVLAGDGTGTFTVLVDGLESMTNYWIRAYAINSSGVAYGARCKFSTI